MKKLFNLLLKIAFVTVLVFLAGLMIAICPTQARGADNYFTISVRELAYHEYEDIPYDYEFVVGGSTVNYKWWIMREREYGIMEKGSLMDWDYTDFRFQYYMKTADNIEFSEAIWCRNVWKDCIVAGGSLYNDIIYGGTKYMGYVKADFDWLSIDYRHDKDDYYNLSVNFDKRIGKGFFKGFKSSVEYRNVNGTKSYSVQVKYNKDRKKHTISPLLKYEDSSNRPKTWQCKLCWDF